MSDDPPPAKGTTNPLFGATPAPDPDVDTDSSSPPAAETFQSSSPPPDGTGNPLFGATPGQDDQSDLEGAAGSVGVKESVKGRVEASSRERVRDLKEAREAALGTATPSSVSDPGISQISECVLNHQLVSDGHIVPHDRIPTPANPFATFIRPDALQSLFPARLPPQTGIPPLPPPRDVRSSRWRVVVLPSPASPR
jgi:hypothetical protein